MSEHVHKFNATIISTLHNGYVRCACGAWSTRWRVRDGGPLLNVRLAKGLDTRVRRQREEEATGIQPAVTEPTQSIGSGWSKAGTTPSVDGDDNGDDPEERTP